WFWDVFQLPDDPETLGFEMEHDDSDPETLGFEMKHDDSWLGYVVRHGLRRLLRDGTPVCGLALTVLSDVLLDWLAARAPALLTSLTTDHAPTGLERFPRLRRLS